MAFEKTKSFSQKPDEVAIQNPHLLKYRPVP
jgi:hypothetical protein